MAYLLLFQKHAHISPRQRELMFFFDPRLTSNQKIRSNKVRLACEQKQGKESGKGKREPVGMATIAGNFFKH